MRRGAPLRPQHLIHPDELVLVLQPLPFMNWLSSYKMTVPPNYPANDLNLFYRQIRPELLIKFRSEFDRLGPIKVNFTMQVRLKKARHLRLFLTFCFNFLIRFLCSQSREEEKKVLFSCNVTSNIKAPK